MARDSHWTKRKKTRQWGSVLCLSGQGYTLQGVRMEWVSVALIRQLADQAVSNLCLGTLRAHRPPAPVSYALRRHRHREHLRLR